MNKKQIEKSMTALNEIHEICNVTIFTDRMTADDCIDQAQDALASIEKLVSIVRDIVMSLENYK